MKKDKDQYDTDPIIQVKGQGWIRTYWRPLMAWQYFAVCLCDFIIFPVAAFWWSTRTGQQWNWEPLTLKEGGFYHMAMGIIVGVAAWQRGQENLLKTKIFGPEIVSQDTAANIVDREDMYIDDDGEDGGDPPAHPTHHNHHA